MKKRNKAFTLIELIIVIAILAIILLIGSVAYAGIQKRAKVRADKATAGQIGKSLVVREADLPKDKGIPLYPVITQYDELEDVENYVVKDIKPQSMKEGNFFATAFRTNTGKKIVVGIGKEGDEFKDNLYNDPKESGWAWSEEVEISEFIDNNKDKIMADSGTGETIIIGTGNGNNINPPEGASKKYTLKVGIDNYLTTTIEKAEGKQVNVNLAGTYTGYDITGIDKTGKNLSFTMPANDVNIIGRIE